MTYDAFRQPWDPKSPVAPFTPEGSLQHYPQVVFREREKHFPDWRPVEPWNDILVLKGHARGRSSAVFEFENTAGQTYPMMLADMVDLVKRKRAVEPGAFVGRWTVSKRGQNYGIRLAREGE